MTFWPLISSDHDDDDDNDDDYHDGDHDHDVDEFDEDIEGFPDDYHNELLLTATCGDDPFHHLYHQRFINFSK